MRFRSRTTLLGIIAGMFVMSAATNASAAPIVQTAVCGMPAEVFGPAADGTCVTGILNLDILGMTYDMAIQVGSGADVFTDEINPIPVPTFWQDQAGAVAAVTAIVDALNNQGGIDGATGTAGSRWFIDVPWDSGGGDGFKVESATSPDSGFTSGSDWENSGTGSCGFGDCSVEAWALFTKIQVPEPGTLALFGLGLAGLGFARRRKAI